MRPAFDQSITDAIELARDLLAFNSAIRDDSIRSMSDADTCARNLEKAARDLANTIHDEAVRWFEYK